MIQEAVKPGALQRRPRWSQSASSRLTIDPSHLALVALFAHIFIVAHTISHISHAPPRGLLQHCAVCAVGDHSAAVPTGVLAGCERTAAWVEESVIRPAAPQPDVEETTLARAPPFAALTAIG